MIELCEMQNRFVKLRNVGYQRVTGISKLIYVKRKLSCSSAQWLPCRGNIQCDERGTQMWLPKYNCGP